MQGVLTEQKWCVAIDTRKVDLLQVHYFLDFFCPFTEGGAGREKAVMSRTVIFFFSQTIKLLYYLNVPMLTCLLLNYNVELIRIYSGLCSSLIKIPGHPVKMQMFLSKNIFTKKTRRTCIIQCALSFSRLISVTLLMFVN